MSTDPTINLISKSIGDPLAKSYIAGGYALAFTFVGTLMLVSAMFFGRGIIGYTVTAIGCVAIAAALYYLYFHDIKRLKDVKEEIDRHKELIDAVQLTAI